MKYLNEELGPGKFTVDNKFDQYIITTKEGLSPKQLEEIRDLAHTFRKRAKDLAAAEARNRDGGQAPNLNTIHENQPAPPTTTTASVAEQEDVAETSRDSEPKFQQPVRRSTASSLSSIMKRWREK